MFSTKTKPGAWDRQCGKSPFKKKKKVFNVNNYLTKQTRDQTLLFVCLNGHSRGQSLREAAGRGDKSKPGLLFEEGESWEQTPDNTGTIPPQTQTQPVTLSWHPAFFFLTRD